MKIKSQSRKLAVAFLAVTYGTAAAEDVVVLDVSGTWRLQPTGQTITRHQKLAVNQQFQFVAPAGEFTPGVLILGDAMGNKYYSLPCKIPSACGGTYVVSKPSTPAGRRSTLAEAFFAVVDLIVKDKSGWVNAIDDNVGVAQSGSLADAILPLDGGVLSLCDSFTTMAAGDYGYRLLSEHEDNSITGRRSWNGTCQSAFSVPGVAPGIYRIQTTDAIGGTDMAYVVACPREKFDRISAAFREIVDATAAWNDARTGEVVQSASRRVFLVGYLHWLANDQTLAMTPPSVVPRLVP